jgi:hypothetical protein
MRLLLLLLILTGCAAPQKAAPPPKPLEAPSPGLTKAQVGSALGKGTEIPFDSGYEVWVYRRPLVEKEKPRPTELVLLFTPSGVLSKTRLR